MHPYALKQLADVITRPFFDNLIDYVDWKNFFKTGGKPVVVTLLRRARRTIKETTGWSTSSKSPEK